MPPLCPNELPLDLPALEQMAARLRCDILRMIHAAGEGHPGGSLSATDMIAALYFRQMRYAPTNPEWPERDRFILSKGHACPAWYAALIEIGTLPVGCLCTLRCLGSQLQGHADMRKTPGIDFSSGSLGHGLSAGIGMALGARHQGNPCQVYVIIGDGEMQEGAIWEAALAGAKFKLDNLTVMLDRNRIQNDDFSANVMPMEPVAAKWRAFGWNVIEIDGHDMGQIVAALDEAIAHKGGPTIIVADTVKGKGVSFMEDNPAWHGRAPNDAELEQALAEVSAAAGWEA